MIKHKYHYKHEFMGSKERVMNSKMALYSHRGGIIKKFVFKDSEMLNFSFLVSGERIVVYNF